jgi:hypothetical protein
MQQSLVELVRIKDVAVQAASWQRLLAAGGGRAQARAEARAARQSNDGDAKLSLLPRSSVLTRRLVGLVEMLDRAEATGGAPLRANTELREALLSLRTRIDRLLGEDA